MTVHSPCLRNSNGAELNLRSQILFQGPMRTETADILTSTAAWNLEYVHESSHWARYHASTVGILLTLLRRTRDQLAVYTIQHLDSRDVQNLKESRSSGQEFFSFKHYPKHARGELKYNELDWLNLYFSYNFLLDPEGLTEFDASTWHIQAAFENSLEDTWHQSEGREMVIRRTTEPVTIGGQTRQIYTSEGALTTRILFECAAILDENSQFAGTFTKFANSGLGDYFLESLKGEYGLPCRLADSLAERHLGPSTVSALIDFALNPVVPGLEFGVSSIDWREFYPPHRFVLAARTLANWISDLELNPPTSALVMQFQQELSERSGIRTGRVDSHLSEISSLREAATVPVHLAERTPTVSLMYSSHLRTIHTEDICAISHYGGNFLDEGASNLINPRRDRSWLFPVFRVRQGDYQWPSKSLNMDEATDLLIGAAVAGAYDDVLYGTGPLASSHLPSTVFENSGEVAALNQVFKDSTHLDIGWSTDNL